MVEILKKFLELLKDDKTVSSYELQTSGVVRGLLHCLSQVYELQMLRLLLEPCISSTIPCSLICKLYHRTRRM